MEIKGKIKKILPRQDFPSGFYKQTMVVTIGGRYPQDIPIEFNKEKADLLNGLGVGNEVVVHYDLRGREYNDRHYVDLNGWKVEAFGGSQPAPAPTSRPAQDSQIDDEDIPF